MQIDPILILVIVGVAVLAVLAVKVLSGKGGTEQAARMDQLTEIAQQLAQSQAALAGRLEQAQADTGQRLDALSKRVGDSLMEQTAKTSQSLTQLQERLAVIDRAQQNISDLSQKVVSLQDILSNKQARGAFGEIQLNDLVIAALPKTAYEFQATLANGKRADCLLKLPNPPGPIVIDSKFPLESYSKLRNAETDADRTAAAREFSAAVRKHIKDIAERYIIPDVTAESALMFLPSEAVYAELHANHQNAVEEGYRNRVYIVSPTTLMATLNTVRAVLRDVHMREQADVIQKEVRVMLEDVGRLDQRVGNLQKHFNQAQEDVREIRISTEKVLNRGGRIDALQLGDADEPAALLPGGKAAE